jgi:hypothetical protein
VTGQGGSGDDPGSGSGGLDQPGSGSGGLDQPGSGSGGRGGTGGGNSGATSGMPMGGGGGMPMGSGGGTTGGACDLSGRWLATEHLVTEAIGQRQTAHAFLYYEIGRDGAGFKITKGMYCGNDAASTGVFAVQVDFSRAQANNMAKINFMGRTVTSTKSAGGCDVHFGKWYVVRGATLPHFLDPSIPLPTAMQQAADGMPGWEDWDGDGQPGITGSLTGTVVGRIFTAPRQWTEQQGTVSSVATAFTLPVTWDQEANVMAYDPPSNFTLGASSVRAGDPTLHFVDFARLAADQATGDNAAICAAVVKLVPTLTPKASAI